MIWEYEVEGLNYLLSLEEDLNEDIEEQKLL